MGKWKKLLSKVFKKNIFPQIDKWIEHSEQDGQDKTKRALTRYTLNHLYHLLDDGQEHFFPEEFYLCPPMSDSITTGSIVKENASDQPFVVLSPACDLVSRNKGGFKTDRILLVSIEQEDNIMDEALKEIKKMRDNRKKKEKMKEKIEEVFKNNYTYYYHWLPKTDIFPGGFLNFRKLKALEEDCFREKFGKPMIQISPSFVKDIVSRFSSFYARQGQPDIESKDFVTRHLDRVTNTA